MLCDFTSGLGVVSHTKIVAAQNCKCLFITFFAFPKIKMLVTATLSLFESLNAGSWHNRFPSLIDARAGQERWDHRAGNISSEESTAIKSRLEAALVRPEGLSSGIEWRTHFQIIVDRFSGRLELMRHLLNSAATDPNEIFDFAHKAQTQLRIMLTPYLLLSAAPSPLDETDLDWSISVFKLRATTHTKFLESKVGSMTESERLLLQALRGTSREICRVVTKMWAAGVSVGVDPSLNTKESPSISEVTRVWGTWVEDLNQLVGWLDWNVWIKCNPSCGPEEICYIHRWPATFPQSGLQASSVEHSKEDLWGLAGAEPQPPYRPQPKCVSLVEP